MLFFTNVDTLSARSVFNFPDIRCVVTLYNFPRISRQLEKPLPNMIMKILSCPYMFMEGVSNCLSLLAHFSILPKISGLYQKLVQAQNLLEKLGKVYTSNFLIVM